MQVWVGEVDASSLRHAMGLENGETSRQATGGIRYLVQYGRIQTDEPVCV